MVKLKKKKNILKKRKKEMRLLVIICTYECSVHLQPRRHEAHVWVSCAAPEVCHFPEFSHCESHKENKS